MIGRRFSLAAERKQRERDFTAERADLTQELRDIGVEEEELVQHVMFVKWAVFKAASMFEYHGIDQDAQAIVELKSDHGEAKMRRANTANPLLQLLERYFQQRRARKRGIAWELSYWQWLEIWQTSGHLEERGRSPDHQTPYPPRTPS